MTLRQPTMNKGCLNPCEGRGFSLSAKELAYSCLIFHKLHCMDTVAKETEEKAWKHSIFIRTLRSGRAETFISAWPGVNIYRAPLCGRNFEYFGEDPYLTGETAKQYILGVQSEGVIATIKHFAANNQEWSRHHASSDIDERTLHEIYFPAFRKAVQEANVSAVMNSYNLLNGVHATEHKWLNIDVLRNLWGFKGILMSDWTSVYSAIG